jgi:6-phosphogluconolactonase (cycloisomerase 2 family)
MSKAIRGLVTIALSVGAITSTMYAAENVGSSSTVFVMTNDTVKNKVLVYQRLNDGSFASRGSFATGGRGSGGTTDPLQSQGSLTLSGDHHLLFAINAGSGTISSFDLLGGLPVLVDQEPTGGAFPVAVAEHNGIVYVLNAGGNGAIVAFRADRFGHLSQIPDSTALLTATNSGASDISISPNGNTLVVIEKDPENIDTFPINPNGTLGTVVVNHSVTPGVFGVVFTPNGQLIVSEDQPNGTDVSSISSYTLNANGTLTAISQSLRTFGDGNCWNAITPNGKFVYADNSASSTIAGFSVGSNGALTPIGQTIVATYPAGTINLDMAVSGNGEFLYTLNSGTGTVGIYSINADGTLSNPSFIEGLPKAVGFNGIATR